MTTPASPNRRRVLAAGIGLAVVRPAAATPEAMAEAIGAFTGGAPLREGRVKLAIEPLVENGNTVPVGVAVEGVAPGEVAALAVFTQRNPQPEVVRFAFGPLAAVARADTRIRLATSQQVAAVAKLVDGSCWVHRVEVIVTLAACVE